MIASKTCLPTPRLAPSYHRPTSLSIPPLSTSSPKRSLTTSQTPSKMRIPYPFSTSDNFALPLLLRSKPSSTASRRRTSWRRGAAGSASTTASPCSDQLFPKLARLCNLFISCIRYMLLWSEKGGKPKLQMDRTSILGDAIDYMRELLERINKLREETHLGENQLSVMSIFKDAKPANDCSPKV